MYAVVKIGGSQYRVSAGDFIKTQKLAGEPGAELSFEEVLYLSGDEVSLGRPLVKGAYVKAVIEKQARDKTLIVARFKRRGGRRVRNGHRQPYTRLRITEIGKN